MKEQGERSCYDLLPTRRTALVTLIILATAMTLVLVHVTGQWVGHRMFTQTYNPLTPQHNGKLVNSLEGSGKNIGKSWLRSQGNKRTNKDWLTEKHPSPRQLMVGSDKKDTPESVDFPQEKTLSFNNIFRERQGLDSPTKEHMNLPSRSPTNRTSPLDVFWGTAQSQPIIGRLKNDSDRPLQGTIRKEMLQHAVKHQPHTPLEEKNHYNWNDLDPRAKQHLPLRHKGDSTWKKKDALVFNRVGKCGSRSVINILCQLADKNDFHLISSTVYNKTSLNKAWQESIVKTLEQVQTPYLFQRHIHFVDFTEFNANQPMYINIVRDPLARFVSNYYFKRFGDGRSRQNFKGSDEARHRSVTDCIINGYKECVQSAVTYIIPFFCGQLKECRKPSQWALERAQKNVEKHFVAVGILEDMENSFKVFEKVLPQFFKGAVQLLLTPDTKQAVKNASTTTKFKEKPSEEAETIMKHLMYYEFKFYYFIKERLEQQMAYYDIKS